jgi:predicted amidohydrolase YtcJ
MYLPQRVTAGLKTLVTYLHRNGVTTLNQPGVLITPQLLDLYKSVLGAEDTPFYSFFLPDGRGIFDRNREEGTLRVTQQIAAMASSGKVRFLPRQVKLFADGAIISQLMQIKDGYIDGHKGECIAPPADVLEDPRKVDPMKLREAPIWGTVFEGRLHKLAARYYTPSMKRE